MPRKGRSNEEIIHALHQVEGGEKVTGSVGASGSASRRSTAGRNNSRISACRSCVSSDRCATKMPS